MEGSAIYAEPIQHIESIDELLTWPHKHNKNHELKGSFGDLSRFGLLCFFLTKSEKTNYPEGESGDHSTNRRSQKNGLHVLG